MKELHESETKRLINKILNNYLTDIFSSSILERSFNSSN